jgi:hypothetical protein
MQHVEVESDALVLIQAVSADEFDHAPNGVLFREIKYFSKKNSEIKSFSLATLIPVFLSTVPGLVIRMVRSWSICPKPYGRMMLQASFVCSQRSCSALWLNESFFPD